MASHDNSVSRRGAIELLSIAGTLLAVGGTAHGANKIPQKGAQYQDHPNGSSRCADCTHFVAPNSCAVVDGTISPDGWCLMFAKKT